MDYREQFRVDASRSFQLSSIDPDFHAPHQDKSAALPLIERNVVRLRELQMRLYAERKRSVLICLQGMDAAGKDGLVTHVMRGVNPMGCIVHSFKSPSEADAAHDFLWRYHLVAPAKGWMSILNRTQYEAVLIEKVDELASKREIAQRYACINDFERLLSENGVTILKFYLHISKDEQLARFKERLDDPMKRWKISESDYAARRKWDAYVDAYEIVLSKCATSYAPWYVVPANRKWFRDLVVSQIIADTMDEMNIGDPPVRVDIDRIRREFHAASKRDG